MDGRLVVALIKRKTGVVMNDKQILKRLLELGLEKLIEQSGQTLEDFIDGQNIQPQPTPP